MYLYFCYSFVCSAAELLWVCLLAFLYVVSMQLDNCWQLFNFSSTVIADVTFLDG